MRVTPPRRYVSFPNPVSRSSKMDYLRDGLFSVSILEAASGLLRGGYRPLLKLLQESPPRIIKSDAQPSLGSHGICHLLHAQILQSLSGWPAVGSIPALQFVEVGLKFLYATLVQVHIREVVPTPFTIFVY